MQLPLQLPQLLALNVFLNIFQAQTGHYSTGNTLDTDKVSMALSSGGDVNYVLYDVLYSDIVL